MKDNNHDSKPKIYFDPASMNMSNQTVLRKNYLAQILSQQQETNQTLSHSVSAINAKLEETSCEQEAKHSQLMNKLEDQVKVNEHLKFEVNKNDLTNQEIILRLTKLEQMNEEVSKALEEERILSQATIDQLTYQEDLTRKIHNKLEGYEKQSAKVLVKMQEQEPLYEHIQEKLEIQDMYHKTVMERLDKQDVKQEKMASQIDSLGTVLVNKIDDALQSIESKYKETLHYLRRIFNKKEKDIYQYPISLETKEKEKAHSEKH
ncbi:hypothetical protein [Sutcliffiella deserti]|uniref:hypothetical protein n=1 Tax=Sutcliffiella deserti TaxID=2875501 RepID=UPI001CBE5003|nr:hypothetical protein [Sutcliffiella deserti]